MAGWTDGRQGAVAGAVGGRRRAVDRLLLLLEVGLAVPRDLPPFTTPPYTALLPAPTRSPARSTMPISTIFTFIQSPVGSTWLLSVRETRRSGIVLVVAEDGSWWVEQCNVNLIQMYCIDRLDCTGIFLAFSHENPRR